MPHVIEPAVSGRASCRACGTRIPAGSLRFGERRPNPFAEDAAEITHWFHLPCAAFRRPEPFLEALSAAIGTVPDRTTLAREAELGILHRRLPRLGAASRAPTGRATCRYCHAPIARGAWRLALVYEEDGRFVPGGFVHAACTRGYTGTSDVMDRLAHFSELDEAAAAEVQTEIAREPQDAQS